MLPCLPAKQAGWSTAAGVSKCIWLQLSSCCTAVHRWCSPRRVPFLPPPLLGRELARYERALHEDYFEEEGGKNTQLGKTVNHRVRMSPWAMIEQLGQQLAAWSGQLQG